MTHNDANDTENTIKCDNYVLCNAKLPEWWHSCKGTLICTNCDILTYHWQKKGGRDKLIIKDNVECSICLETKTGVLMPKCEQYMCTECFRKCYWSNIEDEEFDSDTEEEISQIVEQFDDVSV